MINYYNKSIKAFKRYLKQNPQCTREEWDQYAHKNCLFSANTLMFHMFHENLLKYLNKKNINKFEYLKNMFLWIPIKYRDKKIFKIIIKIKDINTREKEWM